MNASEISIFITFSTNKLFVDHLDPMSKLINYTGLIFLDDDKGETLIGSVEVSTNPVNILKLSPNDAEILDCYDRYHRDAYFTLIDEDSLKLNIGILPDGIVKKLKGRKKVNVLSIPMIALWKEYRGYNLSSKVFDILKVMFSNHLFLIKPYPFELTERNHIRYSDNYEAVSKEEATEGINKLVALYHRNGFSLLNIKTKEPYMVLLSI